MRVVEIGSRAEHGSSSSSTSGLMAMQRAMQRRLAAARRADERGHPVRGNVERDVVQRLEVAVVEVEAADAQLCRQLRGIGLLAAAHRSADSWTLHRLVLVMEQHARNDV